MFGIFSSFFFFFLLLLPFMTLVNWYKSPYSRLKLIKEKQYRTLDMRTVKLFGPRCTTFATTQEEEKKMKKKKQQKKGNGQIFVK